MRPAAWQNMSTSIQREGKIAASTKVGLFPNLGLSSLTIQGLGGLQSVFSEKLCMIRTSLPRGSPYLACAPVPRDCKTTAASTSELRLKFARSTRSQIVQARNRRCHVETRLPGVPDVVLTPKLRRQMVHKAGEQAMKQVAVCAYEIYHEVMLSAEALKRYDAKRMMLGNAKNWGEK